MLQTVAELFAQILFWREDYKFSKKKKARRQFQKENNLPKKIMIHPVLTVFILAIVLIPSSIGIFNFMKSNFFGRKNTVEKISKIKAILENEKKVIGIYPDSLKKIIRNNPMRSNINYDAWNNEFYYQQLENGLHYSIKSKGRDGILNTEDDID